MATTWGAIDPKVKPPEVFLSHVGTPVKYQIHTFSYKQYLEAAVHHTANDKNERVGARVDKQK